MTVIELIHALSANFVSPEAEVEIGIFDRVDEYHVISVIGVEARNNSILLEYDFD